MKNTLTKPNRLYYLDNLKLFMTILVILHHVAIAFGGEGGFIIRIGEVNQTASTLLTAFLAINQSYFMGIFFAISAYFSWKSLNKKGKKDFIIGKIKRLLLPAVIYLAFISPLLNWIISRFYYHNLDVRFYDRIGLGALWFVAALALFDIVFALFHSDKKTTFDKKIPGYLKALGITLIVAVITWVVRIFFKIGHGISIIDFQPAHFPQYIYAYIIGIMAAKYKWLDTFNTKRYKWLLLASLGLIVALLGGMGALAASGMDIIPAFGGFNPLSFAYGTWEQLMFITMLFALVALFKEAFNFTNRLTSFMSKGAYLTYIVHSAVIMTVVMLLGTFNLSYGIYLTTTAILSVVCYFTAGYWLKPVFKL